MKKIISLVLAITLCMALAAPAFAEDATVVTPTDRGDGSYEIKRTSAGDYIIKENCVVCSLFIMNCTLTIAEGVTVTVTNNAGNMGGVLNIGSGAVLECSGADFSNSNGGTMNVYGTVTFRGNGKNSNSGIINKYCSGAVNGSISNKGIMNTGVHDWKDGECTLCHTKCTHDSWTGNVCNTCKFACPHTGRDNGFCTACGDLDITTHTHDFTTGTCKCGERCPHENTFTKTFCADCNMEIEPPTGTVSDVTASTLSEGSLTIVCSVACLAVGLVGGLLLGKKKRVES